MGDGSGPGVGIRFHRQIGISAAEAKSVAPNQFAVNEDGYLSSGDVRLGKRGAREGRRFGLGDSGAVQADDCVLSRGTKQDEDPQKTDASLHESKNADEFEKEESLMRVKVSTCRLH